MATNSFKTLMAASAVVGVLLVMGTGMGSCNGCKNEPADTLTQKQDSLVADSDTIAEPEIIAVPEITGTVDEGTTMHVLLLQQEDVDSLVEMELANGPVLGGMEVGEKVRVVYNEQDGQYTAVIAVNLSTLRHLWAERTPNGKTSRLELNDNGKAITYGSIDGKNYDGWDVTDGMLLLHSSESVGKEYVAPTDTFQISVLSGDSLIIFNQSVEHKFRRYN